VIESTTNKARPDRPPRISLDELLEELIEKEKLKQETIQEIAKIYIEEVSRHDKQPRDPPGNGISIDIGSSKGKFNASIRIQLSTKQAVVLLGTLSTILLAYAPTLQPLLSPLLTHFK
jgi:hypothetical protein